MERTATFDFALLYRGVWWSAAAVILLGLFREFYVGAYGLETPLGSLRLISLQEKHSLQAWQQSSLGLIGAFVAMALAASESAASGLKRYWVALIFVGLYISFDEQVSFHQAFVPILRTVHVMGAEGASQWVVVGIPIALLVGVFFIPFFRKVPPRFAVQFFLSGILFIGAGIGLEVLGSAYPGASLPFIVESVVEEILESVGMAIFAVTMLEYWRLHRQDIRISVVRS